MLPSFPRHPPSVVETKLDVVEVDLLEEIELSVEFGEPVEVDALEDAEVPFVSDVVDGIWGDV